MTGQDVSPEALRLAVRMRDEFVSRVGHELRTPLAAAALQSDWLLRSLGSNTATLPPREWLLARIEGLHGSLCALEHLVEVLLDTSALAAGKLLLRPAEVDLAGLLQTVAARFQEPASQGGSALSVHAPGPVPGHLDRERLDQVVSHLLSNAVKFGNGAPIDVSLTASGPVACFEVRDGGLGIAPEDRERIFERFERAVSVDNYGGFGLGLWVVRQVLGAMGGRVEVTSEPGLGSTFTVELPMGREAHLPGAG